MIRRWGRYTYLSPALGYLCTTEPRRSSPPSPSSVNIPMPADKQPTGKAKTSEKAAPRPSLLARLLTTLWRPFHLLTAAAILSTLMFWPEIVRQMPELRSRPEYQLAWTDISITPPGRWVPPDLITRVQKNSGLPDPLPVLDDGLVERLAIAFQQYPWVAEVKSVSKSGPQCVHVEMRYRTPVLMVRMKRGGLYQVDREGILLPPLDFAPADAERLPVLRQVRSLPKGPAGTAWGDDAVLGAARLAEALTTELERSSAWETFGMAAIAVLGPERPAESLDEVTLGLMTSAGSQVIWGRPPGADELEPTVEQKLLRLDRFLPKLGDTEWSTSPVRLDVRRWDVVDKVELSRNPREDARLD